MLRKLLFIVLGIFIASLGAFLLLDETNLTGAEGERYIVARMESCHRAEIQKKCMQELSVDLLDNFSIPEILAVFSAHEAEEAFFKTCHEQSHYLGREAYKRIGSVVKIYAESNESCLGGVFHGALEGYFIEKDLVLGDGNMEKLKSAVTNICDEVEAENPNSLGLCHHGLGHALMFPAEDHLPDALALCDALENPAYRDNCYTGAFMQNVNNASGVDHPKTMLDPDNPLYPCPVLEERYQPICYSYAVLEQFQGQTSKGIELCHSVPEIFRTDCFRTLGRNATMYSTNSVELKSRCLEISEQEYREACLQATAGYLVVRYGLASNLAFEFCSVLGEGEKSGCYEQLGYAAKMLATHPTEISEFCQVIGEAANRQACLQGGL